MIKKRIVEDRRILLEACKDLVKYFEEADDFCTKDEVTDDTNPYHKGLRAINKAERD